MRLGDHLRLAGRQSPGSDGGVGGGEVFELRGGLDRGTYLAGRHAHVWATEWPGSGLIHAPVGDALAAFASMPSVRRRITPSSVDHTARVIAGQCQPIELAGDTLERIVCQRRS